MALFEFKLKPLTEVLPWEHNGKQYLHWYGLTDGIYYLNLKGNKLFESSREYMDYLNKVSPGTAVKTPYIDYQVIRLYEDLLEILPNILQNIPGALVDLIGSFNSEEDFLKGSEYRDDNKNMWDIYHYATLWWECRCLTSMHLQYGPNIHFWLFDEAVHIRWNNSAHCENGIQIWNSLKGEVKYSKTDFVEEVKSFHNRLMNEMEKRIIEIEYNNPIVHVHLDLPQLKNEQKERRKSLQTAMKSDPDIKDWNKVIKAIRLLKNQKKVPS